MKSKIQRMLSLLLVFCMMMSFIPAIQPAHAAQPITWNIENFSPTNNGLASHYGCGSSPYLLYATVVRQADATTQGLLQVRCTNCGQVVETIIPTVGWHQFDKTVTTASGTNITTYNGSIQSIVYTNKAGPFQESGTLKWPAALLFPQGRTASVQEIDAGIYRTSKILSNTLSYEGTSFNDLTLFNYQARMDDLIIQPVKADINSFPNMQYVYGNTGNLMTEWSRVQLNGADGSTKYMESYLYPITGLGADAPVCVTYSTDQGANALKTITAPGLYSVDLMVPQIVRAEPQYYYGYAHNYSLNTIPSRYITAYVNPIDYTDFTTNGTVSTFKDTAYVGLQTYLMVLPNEIGPLYVGDPINAKLTISPTMDNFCMTVYPGENNEYANITNKAGIYTVPLEFIDETTGYAMVTNPVSFEVRKWEADHIEPLADITTYPVGTNLSDIVFPNVTVISKPRVDQPTSGTSRFTNIPAHFEMKAGTTFDPTSTAEQTVYGHLVVEGSYADEMLYDPDNIEFSIKIRLQSNGTPEYAWGDAEKPYTGSPISHEVYSYSGLDAITYTYEGINGTTYGPTTMPPTNVGSYQVTAVFTSSVGYESIPAATHKLTVVKGTQALPDSSKTPVLDSVTTTTITLKPPADGGPYEYSRDNGTTWQDSPTFTGLLPGTNYTFVQRLKETDNYNPSEASNPATFQTTELTHTVTLTADKTSAIIPDTITLEATNTTNLDESYTETFLWYKDGTLVPGATAKTLTISAVEDSGSYTVASVILTADKRINNQKTSNELSVRISSGDIWSLLPDNWRDYLLLDDITYGEQLGAANIRFDIDRLLAEHPECSQAGTVSLRFNTPLVNLSVPDSRDPSLLLDVIASTTVGGYADETFTIPATMVTVNPAPLEIKAPDVEIFFGDDPTEKFSSLSPIVTGFVLGEGLSTLSGTLIYTSSYNTQYQEIPESMKAEIVPSGLTSENYSITYTPGIVSVRLCYIPAIFSGQKYYGDPDPEKYDIDYFDTVGRFPEPFETEKENLKKEVVLVRTPGEDVGSYRLKYDKAYASEHFLLGVMLSMGGESINIFKILPRPVNVIWEVPDKLVETGSDLSSQIKAYYIDINGDKIYLDISFTQNGVSATPAAQGSYDAVATDNSAGGKNYELANTSKQIVIEENVPVDPEATDYVTFPTASPIQLGETLGDSTLTGGNGGPTGTGTYEWKNPSITPDIGTSSWDVVFTPSPSDPTDYTHEPGYDPDTGTITRKVSITVTKRAAVDVSKIEVADSKTYDGTTYASVLGNGAISVIAGDDVSISVSANYDTKDVGTNKPITVHFTISGTDAWRYTIPDDFTVQGAILKAPLVIEANSGMLTYGDALNTLGATIKGFVSGETADVLTGSLICSIEGYNQWDDVFSGTRKITPSGFSAQNYEITYESGEVTMQKRTVVIVPSVDNKKTYGDRDPDLIYSNRVTLPADVPTFVTEEIKGADIRVTRTPGENAGSYDYTISGSGSTNFEYSLDPANKFLIEKKQVSLTWTGLDTRYITDGTDQSAKIGASYQDIDGNTVQANITFRKNGSATDGAFQTAGLYTVTAHPQDSNYVFSNDSAMVQMYALSESGVPDPAIKDVTPTTIEIDPIENGEYSIDGGVTWQTSPIFSGLTPDTTYPVKQRIPDPDSPGSYLESNSVDVKTGSLPTLPPPTIEKVTETSAEVKPIEDGEYSIDGGKTWQTSPEFPGLKPGTSYEIIQRVPNDDAPGGYIQSPPTTIQTPDVAGPTPPMIRDVTDTSIEVQPIEDGEYSIDGGETWQTSPIFPGLKPDTDYEIIQRIPKPGSPDEYLVSEPTHVRTEQDPTDNRPGRPVISEVTDTSITVEPIPGGEYSIDGGKTWQPDPTFPGLTPGTSYEIIQRIPDPTNPDEYLVSDPEQVTTDPAPAPEKPAKPEVEQVTSTTVTMKPINGGEYSIDGGDTWQVDPKFSGLAPDTIYNIIQRIPNPDSPGDYVVSDSTEVKTDPDTIPDPVVDSKSSTTIYLKGITNGEYSADGGKTWQKSPVFAGLTPDTTYDIIQRVPIFNGYLVSNPISVTTNPLPDDNQDVTINYPDETLDFDPDKVIVTGPDGEEYLPGDHVQPGTTITIIDKETGDQTEMPIPNRPSAPDVSLDTKNEIITTKPGMEYSTDGGYTWKPAPDGLPVDGLEGSTILVRFPATDDTFSSEITEIEVPVRGEGPDVSSTPASGESRRDGALTGTTANMEYSPDGGLTWYPCGNGTTSGLLPGEYLVRYKATDRNLASHPTYVIISVKRPTTAIPSTGGSSNSSGSSYEDADSKYGHFVQPGRPWGAGTGNPNMTDGPSTIIMDGDVALSGFSGCPSEPYVDVDQSQWYHDAVDFTVANGLMVGFNSSEWGPNREMTRYQMIQVLYRIAGCPEGYTLNGVSDIPEGFWAYNALAWAYTVGVTDGISLDRFAPDEAISYEQMATMLYRFLSIYGINFVTGESSTSYDRNEVSDYAQASMTAISASGIFNVHGTTSISAKGTMTRATAAQVITNFCTLYNTQFQTNTSLKGTQQATYTNPGVMDNVTHVLYT